MIFNPSAAQSPARPAAAGSGGELFSAPLITQYRLAVPPYRFRFPRDHAAHPEFQTEWWYYTGHLSSGGRRFGFELTFFQVGIDPERKKSKSAWAPHTLYFGHFAVTDEDRGAFHYTESASRPALGMAGSETRRYRVWIHDWSAELLPDGKTHRLKASVPDFGIDLDLTPLKPPALHGIDGVFQKSAGLGRASHYYSMTRLESRGTLRLNGERLPVTGLAWMDHEFGSNQLTPQEAGWDWFSLQLENNRELMLYTMRLKDGGVEPESGGTIVNPDGTWKRLPLAAFQARPAATWRSPRTRAVYPSGWTVRVPAEGLDLRITPTVADQELVTSGSLGVTYWEGSVRVEGNERGKPVRGVGYVELTGYTGAAPAF